MDDSSAASEGGGVTTHHTFSYDGLQREFWFHLPPCANTTTAPMPLVLMLHGWGERGSTYAGLGESSQWREGGDHWADVSDSHCFAVAWPQGTTSQLGQFDQVSSWNAVGCSEVGTSACDAAAVRSVYGAGGLCSSNCNTGANTCATRACAWCSCTDDVGFLTRLIRSLLASDLQLDSRRVYVAGCSNGGMMAYEMAMRSPPGLIAAFVTNCGLPHVGTGCVPPLARPHLHIHATNDRTIPPDGSPASAGGWLYTNTDATLDLISAAGDCDRSPSSEWAFLRDLAAIGNATNVASLPFLRGLRLGEDVTVSVRAAPDDRCQLHSSCSSDVLIVSCTGRFGHDWPDWSASVAWRFLSQYTTDNVAHPPPDDARPPGVSSCSLWPDAAPASPVQIMPPLVTSPWTGLLLSSPAYLAAITLLSASMIACLFTVVLLLRNRGRAHRGRNRRPRSGPTLSTSTVELRDAKAPHRTDELPAASEPGLVEASDAPADFGGLNDAAIAAAAAENGDAKTDVRSLSETE